MRNPFRRTDPRDEGSMPMAMLVSLVAMTMSASLVPVVVNQFTSTRFVDARTVSLDAAQAGIDVALAHLRASGAPGTQADGTAAIIGALASLPPCTLTGSQDSGGLQDTAATSGRLKYSVAIKYYGYPTSGTSTTPVELPCPPTSVPVRATITATGSGTGTGSPTAGSLGTRTLEATYSFRTSNANIAGGLIPLASPAAPSRLCMDANGTISPAAGAFVYLAVCDDGNAAQHFEYAKNLAIKIVNPNAAATAAGMCLDAAFPRSVGDDVTFQPCQVDSARQEWSLNSSGNFQGSKADGSAVENFCLNAATAGAPGKLRINTCSGTTNKNVFRPEAGVGAGMASAQTGQIVNYKQFSRCLDVTNFVVGSDYMIVWFCKQSPDKIVPWNQRWTLPNASFDLKNPIKGHISTPGADNKGYCLVSPGNTTGYVTLTECSMATNTANWTVYGQTTDSTLSYAIVDYRGLCLTPTLLSGPDKDVHPTDGTAKAKVAVCSPDELQKWNAPPNFNDPLALTGVKEK